MERRGELGLADAHIADAERRIARQRELIAELERDGHDAKPARELLETMLGLLHQMQRHRALILERSRRRRRG
jgi:hypothetical protein